MDVKEGVEQCDVKVKFAGNEDMALEG